MVPVAPNIIISIIIMSSIPQLAEGIIADLWRDFWICETETGQQVAQLHDRYTIIIIIIIIILSTNVLDLLQMQYTSSEPNWLYHGTEQNVLNV
jgi:hypothetical protein